MPPLPGAHAQPSPAGLVPSANPHGDPAADNNAGLPPGHPPITAPGTAPGAAPAMGGTMPNTNGEQGYDPKARLAGQLLLDGKVKGSVSPGDVLFLVARIDDGSERGGMILGVKRFVAGSWPIDFELDGRDAMAPGTKFEGKVLLSARVDKDGDAMTKNAGDVLGVAHLTIPQSGIKLVLDTVTK